MLEELDKHKTDSRLGHQAQQTLSYLLEHKEEFDLPDRGPEGNTASCLADNRILDEILLSAVEAPFGFFFFGHRRERQTKRQTKRVEGSETKARFLAVQSIETKN